MVKILKTSIDRLIQRTKELGDKVSNIAVPAFASTTAFLAEKDLLNWTESLTKSAASIYDKALDAEYLLKNIGGGNHRLFDEGHDLLAAWERVRETTKDDSFNQEVIGYISALWKDVTTTKGLPFLTLDKVSYDQWVERISEWIPGVDRQYLYDLMSFDVMELFSSTLGGVAVLFALNREDEKRLAEILGSMGIVSIFSANPIMGIFVTAAGGYAYWKQERKIKGTDMATGAVMSAISMAIFTTLGLPILMELIIVMVITVVLKKHILNNAEVMDILKQNLVAAGSNAGQLIIKLKNQFNDSLQQGQNANDIISRS